MIGASGFSKAPESTRSNAEGWTWVRNSTKWHYFRDKKTICGKWWLFKHPVEGYEIGNDGSANNCAACKREILKEQGTAT